MSTEDNDTHMEEKKHGNEEKSHQEESYQEKSY
jgi:hypothetical protein